MLRALILLFFVLLSLVALPVDAQRVATEVTLQEYHGRVQAAIERLERANDQASGNAVRRELGTIETVVYPSGQVVTLAPLLAQVKEPDQMLARLKIVEEQIRLSAHDRTAARLAVLQEVLDRTKVTSGESWWQQFVRWLGDWLRRYLPELPQPRVNPPASLQEGVNWTLGIIGGILLAVILSYWLQGIIRNFVRDVRLKKRSADADEMPLTSAEARQQANDLAQVGDYRQAVRRLYLSALLSLEEAGLVNYDRSLTNREVLAHTEANRSVQQHLRPVVDTFDQVWYGIREPDANTFTTYSHEIDQLATLAERQQEK